MAFAGLIQDLTYGLRLLRRQPGHTAVAVLTMALGIGATTMLFGVAYGVLMKPLPWPETERLVRVTETRQGRTGRVAGTISNGTYLAWQDRPATIRAIGGWLTQTVTLSGTGEPARIPINPVTASLFRVLEARPLVGRLFSDHEGVRGQPGLIILSYGLWQERFGGRADVVGHVVQLDERPHTVVGVMPREFVFPDRETRAWTAWSVPGVVGEGGVLVGVIFRSIARLQDGVAPAQAGAEATARARNAPSLGVAASALFGAEGPIDVTVVPELEAITADVRPGVLVLLAAVALLLVTAVANVASLQLARATTRRREMALRAAIGAGQRRIVRQLLIENGLIGLFGGVAGVALAAALQSELPALLPAGFPRLDAVTVLDVRVLGVAVMLSVAASVACGLMPAWHTRRLNLVETLVEDGTAPAGGGWRSPLVRSRALIMVGQVAVACVLLLGAALLTRSLVTLIDADRGYDPVNVLTARLPLPPAYPPERRGQLLDALMERLRVTPGVTHAAYSTSLPLVSSGGFIAFKMPSPRDPAQVIDVQATQRVISPEYFAAMRLRLIAGRALADADTAMTLPAVVVNETFVREYLGDRAVGARIPARGARAGRLRFVNEAEWEIVGVVSDMRQEGVDAPRQPEIYASFRQLQPAALGGFDPILILRTAGDPADAAAPLRALVGELAPTVALDSVMTMEDRVMTSLARPRLYAGVLIWFGLFAALIAGVGIFGVTSFTVAQRTREIGVRSALGASVGDIVALVLRQAAMIVAAGIAVGLGAGWYSARLLTPFLYGITPGDALTFVAVPLAVTLVAALACIVPARRAARVDSVTALRTR